MAPPVRAPWSTSARQTTWHWRQSAKASDAAPKPAPVPSPPPSAQRCAGPPLSEDPSNNPAAAPHGPHARSPSSVHQRKPQSDPQSLFCSRDPSQPPTDRNLDNHLILNQDQMRPTDSAIGRTPLGGIDGWGLARLHGLGAGLGDRRLGCG